jgi:predicted permease
LVTYFVFGFVFTGTIVAGLVSDERVFTIPQDVKYGLRQLWCNPGFAVVAILTLALGIGANTSIFSLLNALLLRPLPVQRNAGLVGVYRGDDRPCSYPDFLDFEQRATAFSGLAADLSNESALDVGDTSEVVLAEAVSYNYAEVLEVQASLGRWFAAGDQPRADQFPAVISYLTWQSRFGGDPQVIGKPVRLESQWYTVVGVAPKNFQGMGLPILTEVWVPLVRYAQHNNFAARIVKNRQEGRVLMIGRLKPGVTQSQAQAQINAVDMELHRTYPRPEARAKALRVETLRGTSDPGYRRVVAQLLILLAAVVGLVLLITCANVANLLLARGVARRREVSIRLALGAGRARICRQMLIESLLLSLFGAAAGLVAAQVSNRLLEGALSSAPSPVAVGASLSLDGRVLGFVLIVSVLTTVLFGLVPALQSSRPDLIPALKGNEVVSRSRRLTLRNLSVVTQVTLSLVLLIMAGLFLRALRNATRIDPGFDAKRLLSARLYVAAPEFNEVTGRSLYRRVLERVRNLPGVRNVTLSYDSPMLAMSECAVPEKANGLGQSITAGSNVVGLNYFATFGIPVLRGRDFAAGDNSSAPSVVIVNEDLARQYWPGHDPIGMRVRVGSGCGQGRGTSAEIVGVVKNAQYASIDTAGDTAVRPYIFFPLEQRYEGYLALVIQTGHEPAGWAAVLRKELRAVDARLRIYEIDALSNQIDRSLWQTRWEASLLGAFGALALLIASVGLYGVIAFVARRRTREFGIRMALGAQRRDVLRLVTGDALAIVLVGVGLGLLVSLAATQLLRGFLYGLSPTDTATYAGAAVLWVAVSLIASSVPAYRACRVDPSVALRDE